MLREPLLMLSRVDQVKQLVQTMPVSSGIVSRYVAGESTQDAVQATRELADQGIRVTLDYLGEDTYDRAQADAIVRAYLEVMQALGEAALASSSEVSLKLTALGLGLGEDGPKIALENVRMICSAARNAGLLATIDMEDHTTTDATLEILSEVRKDFPQTGGVLQAYLHRTESDCRDFAYEGSRIRLCKGAYDQPESVAYRRKQDVDLSYVRCLKVLMAGRGYPMVATHDPRMIEIAGALAARSNREPGSYEYQMLYGMRPAEQLRLAKAGHPMRVYIPYGQDWYGYLVRRLAERPQNLGFFLRSLMSKK